LLSSPAAIRKGCFGQEQLCGSLLHSLSYSKQSVFVTPKTADNDAKVVPIADGTSNTVTNSNHEGLQTALNKTLSDIISWFKANLLSLNCNKTLFTILN